MDFSYIVGTGISEGNLGGVKIFVRYTVRFTDDLQPMFILTPLYIYVSHDQPQQIGILADHSLK